MLVPMLPKQNCSRRLAVYTLGYFSSSYDSWSFQSSSAKTHSRKVLAIQLLRGTTSWSAYLYVPRPKGRRGSLAITGWPSSSACIVTTRPLNLWCTYTHIYIPISIFMIRGGLAHFACSPITEALPVEVSYQYSVSTAVEKLIKHSIWNKHHSLLIISNSSTLELPQIWQRSTKLILPEEATKISQSR